MKKFIFLFLLAGLLNAQVLKLNNNTVTVDASGNVIAEGNYALQGYSTGKNVFRTTDLILQPGSTPNTDISVSASAAAFNKPTIFNATDMAKTETSGSFTLSADGQDLTLDVTPDVVAVVSITITCHDLNSSSTTEIYFPYITTGGSNLIIKIRKRGSTDDVDWVSILDAGDYFTFTIIYITST